MYSMPRKACTSARGMLKQQQGITMTAIEERKAISIMFLFNEPGIQQSGKMEEWVCVPRAGMVQHRVCGLTACFAFARRWRCNGTAGARAWQADPKPHRPPVPLFLPPLPSYSGSWIQLTPQSPILAHPLALPLPFLWQEQPTYRPRWQNSVFPPLSLPCTSLFGSIFLSLNFM